MIPEVSGVSVPGEQPTTQQNSRQESLLYNNLATSVPVLMKLIDETQGADDNPEVSK